MPQAIQDINGNLTYAYPPQAFQPTHQAMSHHAWARQQNAFAYHYGDDADVDAPTPEHRYGVVSPNGGASRSPAARYRARTEDAEGESDDEYEHGGYAPAVSMKRSRSRSVTSVSEHDSEPEWQPKRKMVKVSNQHQRKAVDTKRQDGRRALMLMEAEEANNGSGRIRYTSNAEDKQTDRVSRLDFPGGTVLISRSSSENALPADHEILPVGDEAVSTTKTS
jgi:hypothetical protein